MELQNSQNIAKRLPSKNPLVAKKPKKGKNSKKEKEVKSVTEKNTSEVTGEEAQTPWEVSELEPPTTPVPKDPRWVQMKFPGMGRNAQFKEGYRPYDTESVPSVVNQTSPAVDLKGL